MPLLEFRTVPNTDVAFRLMKIATLLHTRALLTQVAAYSEVASAIFDSYGPIEALSTVKGKGRHILH